MDLKFYDKKMIDFMEFVIKNNLKEGITNQQTFLDSIGFNFRNISQVKNGLQSFKLHHYQQAIEVFNLDANYFFKKGAPMFAGNKQPTVKELLQEALRRLK